MQGNTEGCLLVLRAVALSARDTAFGQVKDELHACKEELHAVREASRVQGEELLKLRGEMGEVEKQLRESEADGDRLRAELHQQGLIGEEFREAIRAKDEELHSAREELKRGETQLRETRDELQKRNAELKKCKGELEHARGQLNQNRALESELAKNSYELKRVQEQSQALTDEAVGLRRQLDENKKTQSRHVAILRTTSVVHPLAFLTAHSKLEPIGICAWFVSSIVSVCYTWFVMG